MLGSCSTLGTILANNSIYWQGMVERGHGQSSPALPTVLELNSHVSLLRWASISSWFRGLSQNWRRWRTSSNKLTPRFNQRFLSRISMGTPTWNSMSRSWLSARVWKSDLLSQMQVSSSLVHSMKLIALRFRACLTSMCTKLPPWLNNFYLNLSRDRKKMRTSSRVLLQFQAQLEITQHLTVQLMLLQSHLCISWQRLSQPRIPRLMYYYLSPDLQRQKCLKALRKLHSLIAQWSVCRVLWET